MKRPKRGSEPAGTKATPNSPRSKALSRWWQTVSDFRLLAIILGCSCLLAVYENSRDSLPKNVSDVDPAWFLNEQYNLVSTILDLYPERSQGYFLQSYQAAMCWENQFQPAICSQFHYRDLRDVRIALESALERRGPLDEERLFHFYAFVLDRLGEPPEVVDKAVKNWRKHYPYSTLPDPRQTR
jgi:hypothetical protein